MQEPHSKLMPNTISLILCTMILACGFFYVLEFITKASNTENSLMITRSIIIGMYIALSLMTKEQFREVTRAKNPEKNIDILFVSILVLINGIIGSIWIALRFPSSIAHNFETYLLVWIAISIGLTVYYLGNRKKLKGIYPKEEVFK